MESELVCERQVWRRREEGWMKKVPDDRLFHDAGEDWSDKRLTRSQRAAWGQEVSGLVGWRLASTALVWWRY